MSEPDYMMAQVMECCGLEPSEPTYWTNGAGFVVPIREMSRPHLLNTLRYLERKNRPSNRASAFWALRREAARRGFCPSIEEWAEAHARAITAGVNPDAGYWAVWADYGFFSRDGNPFRESEDAEADYRKRYPDQREMAVPDLPFCYQGESDEEYWPIDADDM
jgi:hypothetical protein